jgi:hypothetical protein
MTHIQKVLNILKLESQTEHWNFAQLSNGVWW